MNELQPARLVKPARIIERECGARGWSVNDLAERAGITPETCGKLLAGDIAIDSFTAIRLARAFDTSPDIWINLQNNYGEITGRARDKIV